MATPYVGEIRLVPYTYAPVGWAFCDGSLVSVTAYEALYNLIGTTYGGDGVTTFALPDLRGRTPIHVGQRPGGSNRTLAETGGVEQVTLTASQMPTHAHPMTASSAPGDSQTPAGNSPSADGANRIAPYGTTSNTTMADPLPTGGGQPHDNRPPFLALNFCIALEGIYPSPN